MCYDTKLNLFQFCLLDPRIPYNNKQIEPWQFCNFGNHLSRRYYFNFKDCIKLLVVNSILSVLKSFSAQTLYEQSKL